MSQFGVACKNCRRRARKCDRTLPKCVNCSLRGAKCEGYALRWVNAAVKRKSASDRKTKTPGHETSVLVGGQELRPSAPVATKRTREVARFDQPQRQTDCAWSNTEPEIYERTTRTRHYSLQDGLSRSAHHDRQDEIFPMFKTTMSDDGVGDLVSYYAHEITTAFTLGKGDVETPCSHLILPMSGSIPSIRCAVAATAASHLANRLHDNQLHRRSLHLRLKATELLRTELESGSDVPDLARLLGMLLLAQLDVCSGDCIEFAVHLKAARTFIKQCDFEDTERSFIEQRLAWLDVMDATTALKLPCSSIEDIKCTLNKFRTPPGERVWGLDVFPCPIDLFEHLVDVLFLFDLQPVDQEASGYIINQAIAVGNSVKEWAASADSEHRRHLSEVWRRGILLFLIRIFRLPDDVFDTVDLRERIFSHARCIPPHTKWSYSTSWPLFQAGLLLPREDSGIKAWLRNELRSNFSTLGCFHQKLAVDALEQAWQSDRDHPGTNMGMRKLILY